MLIILSPAKTLDYSPVEADLPLTTPLLVKDTAKLAAVARKLTRADLARIMDISDKLADLTHERFKAFRTDQENAEGLQAVMAFAGDVYEGLKARTLSKEDLEFAQDNVRILSGLYGVLRPLDRLQPYRLEMGIKLGAFGSLYDFWGDRIAKTLAETLKGHADPTLVNLASQEYFGAVRPAALKGPLVTCHFKETRDGEPPKVASFYAKKARGLMARFAIEGRIDRAEGLKAFNGGGYAFQPALSSAGDWVFTRPHP